MAIFLKNVVVTNCGKSGIKIDGGIAHLDNVSSTHNGEHGLEVGSNASVNVSNADFSHNAGYGVFSGDLVVVQRARERGIFPPILTDDALYQALKSVHDAPEPQKEAILKSGPLWMSYAKTGLDVAAALASIASLFKG